MGAGVGLKYVTSFNDDRRVNKLALIAPATPRFKQTPTEPFGMDEATASATLEAVRRGFPETMAAFGGANFHRPDMAATRDWFLSMWLRQPAYAAYKYFKTLLDEDLRDRLDKVDVPVLLLHGRHDQVASPGWTEYMLPRLSNARVVWFENSGHALMVEEPDKFSQAIADFVEDPDHVDGAQVASTAPAR
jgi:non-heme chloroperoxidase